MGRKRLSSCIRPLEQFGGETDLAVNLPSSPCVNDCQRLPGIIGNLPGSEVLVRVPIRRPDGADSTHQIQI